MFHASAFKTSEGEAKFLAAYDDEMKLWPLPYEQVDLPSRPEAFSDAIGNGAGDARRRPR